MSLWETFLIQTIVQEQGVKLASIYPRRWDKCKGYLSFPPFLLKVIWANPFTILMKMAFIPAKASTDHEYIIQKYSDMQALKKVHISCVSSQSSTKLEPGGMAFDGE